MLLALITVHTHTGLIHAKQIITIKKIMFGYSQFIYTHHLFLKKTNFVYSRMFGGRDRLFRHRKYVDIFLVLITEIFSVYVTHAARVF